MRSHTGPNAPNVETGAEAPPKAARRSSRGKSSGSKPTPTDLGPLEGLIGYALKRAQLAAFEEAIQGFAKLDLRPAHYSVLALVAHAPGRKQSDVAAALGIQRANFVPLIDGLERRGLAERRPVPHDRRSYALHLTREGRRVLGRANALVAGVEAKLDAKLGPGGRARLLDLLWRLVVHR
jgi:DNA-binding MarR family transcriptional regulator